MINDAIIRIACHAAMRSVPKAWSREVGSDSFGRITRYSERGLGWAGPIVVDNSPLHHGSFLHKPGFRDGNSHSQTLRRWNDAARVGRRPPDIDMIG